MASGLDDVVAAETLLSDVDGAGGRLTIRGHALAELSGRWSVEAVVTLLLDGFFELPEPEALRAELAGARADVYARIAAHLPHLAALGAYDGMRAGIALLPDGETFEDALRLIAAPAVLLPALLRIERSEQPIPPRARLGHAADMHWMLTGSEAPASARALETYLVTICDHGLNASTFAARVVASTGAGLMSAALAGLGALKGPLHGGAPGPVIEMLDAIGESGNAHAWLADRVERGERLMGFGHRIYRVRDPRADALKAAVRRLGSGGRLAFAEAVERAALDVLRTHKPHRPLETNVEFFTALLLEAVGFPPHAFTGVFAAGRMAGWLAHAREQALTGRLLRPRSHYVGPVPGLAA